MATEGFLALGLDYLSPHGRHARRRGQGPRHDRPAQARGRDRLRQGRGRLPESHPDGNGKVGAVGFCWGGGAVNNLAVAEPNLDAGVAYYGGQPKAEDVPKINAAMMLHYGGLDERINAGIPAYEAALKQAGKTYEIHVYEGANHAFNNDTECGPLRQDGGRPGLEPHGGVPEEEPRRDGFLRGLGEGPRSRWTLPSRGWPGQARP